MQLQFPEENKFHPQRPLTGSWFCKCKQLIQSRFICCCMATWLTSQIWWTCTAFTKKQNRRWTWLEAQNHYGSTSQRLGQSWQVATYYASTDIWSANIATKKHTAQLTKGSATHQTSKRSLFSVAVIKLPWIMQSDEINWSEKDISQLIRVNPAPLWPSAKDQGWKQDAYQ